MKVLSREEFHRAAEYAARKMMVQAQRNTDLNRARAIFNNITDKNITDSYNLYVEILKNDITEDTVLTLTDSLPKNNVDYFLEALGKTRPRCPECGSELRIGLVNTHRSNVVGGNYKTYWFCVHNNQKMCTADSPPECDYMGELTELIPYELAAEISELTFQEVINKKKGCGK